ncbi:hypothetical protein BKA82DRAFT_1006977 [Pisolithus tinctorius]|uniref:Zinc finger PHD-type domain-containing protein n=1 Tax=Pisolithus tinctorius Marx 270 TaxID=870435 RepID=A0A0C3IGQ0_PISTI|nr:hypothetical protein BKA82DRAFT_1006977 [Pisolithus tinctorius]KIN96227.1 hypothetical protein M404DRAFT_1006977 [Pisolithus tinctorius Marx 270]
MAQAITMGPPSSPRETRRSGRRSATSASASASTSKSPDSPASESTPKNKESSRPALSGATSNGRSKKPKQEDHDDGVPHKNGHVNGSASNHGNANGRAKRKGKEKEKAQQTSDLPIEPTSSKLGSSSTTGTAEPHEEDAEEQGITRCICGLNEEDADGGEFMVQCETCNVWQHGLCMGFKSEVELQDDYHCEQCKPERHQELFRRLAKKARQSSTHSHLTTSRLSRSHSPTHMSKPAKRRNTMNSRDAAFDESLKEIMEATAAEAAAATESQSTSANVVVNGPAETHDDDCNSRRKRKRAEDDPPPKKRTRSASSASDPPEIASVVHEELPPPPPPPKRNQNTGGKSGPRSRRGGATSRKAITANVDGAVAEGDEVSSKRSGQNGRSRAAPAAKRPPPSSHASGSVSQDHLSVHKRYHQSGGNNSAENSRAYYRNSHAYAVPQQPLFTSWNLPDYLAHLEHMLPSQIPRPLEVRSVVGPGGRESLDRTMERGVRVKWPSKRMSVGDMNKRVRALVEWVGREQAGAADRGRRREALEKALKEMRVSGEVANLSAPTDTVDGNARGTPVVSDNSAETPSLPSQPVLVESTHRPCVDSKPTMKMMEELMEELISFQERFGPGVKSRERERRPAS